MDHQISESSTRTPSVRSGSEDWEEVSPNRKHEDPVVIIGLGQKRYSMLD